LTPEQLQAVRAERWRQKQNPALTLDEASAWVGATGLCLFLPRRNQFMTPAPSFVEACIGAPSDTPSPAEIENARGLMIRATESADALPLNLFGVHTDQPDFLASPEAFPYIFSLRGGRNWKTPPPKASPLVVETWKVLEPGASLEATEIQAALGREITESAVMRSLFELWSGLRVMPVYTPDGPTRWELTQARFSEAMNAANRIAQTTGLSALVSLYLESVIAATPEEIEIFLSPLTARSKVRDVVNGLAATRQITIVPVETQTMYHIAGSLPEFEEPEPAAEPEKAVPKPAFGARRGVREQRPPFERERRDERPRDRSRTGPPSRERFAARREDRSGASRPPREGERRPFRKFDDGKRPGEGKRPGTYSSRAEQSGERRPFRKFDEGKRPGAGKPPGRYSPRTTESGGERKPFRKRPFEGTERPGGKFPPKKYGDDQKRPRFGADRERPPKKFGGKRPFFREQRPDSAPERGGERRGEQREDRKTGFPPRKGGWKPSRFAKSGTPQTGGARSGSAPFKGPRRDGEDQRGGYRSGQRQTGGRPGGGKFAGKKFGGPQKKFGGQQSRGKPGGRGPGFKSGPKPGGTKPPFGGWKDKKRKNKGKKDDGKNSE
jgi:23S rRNA pseudouridine2605 synthase